MPPALFIAVAVGIAVMFTAHHFDLFDLEKNKFKSIDTSPQKTGALVIVLTMMTGIIALIWFSGR